MKDNKQFTLELRNHTFVSDTDGYLDLNDIWRTLELPEKKRPSEWKSSIKQLLINSEKIRILSGRSGYTKATEDAAIAYAMFVDNDFYLMVVDAFVDLRNGRIKEAVEKAEASGGKAKEAFEQSLAVFLCL